MTTRVFSTRGHNNSSYFSHRFTTKVWESSAFVKNDGTTMNEENRPDLASGPSSPTINRSKSEADTRKINRGRVGRRFYWKFWGRKNKEDDESSLDYDDDSIERELDGEMAPRKFTYKVLADATKNFNSRTIIGRGGFGHVYKGLLKGDDKCVAIKKMHKATSQGKQEYLSEIKILTKLRHRNLVPIVGWCHEKGELLLVYEFMPNGNLGSHLHPDPGSSKLGLDWKTRYKMISGVASALLYLHDEWRQCVLHRDIKPTNIMLDSDFNPRLADFGLARLLNHGSIDVQTSVAGTIGYLAPECMITGSFSRKTDVYSFGVVALEVACGRTPVASSEEQNYRSLVEMVWDLYGKGKLWDGADQRLQGSFDREQMKRLMLVGLWCTLPDLESRPVMRQAKRVLNFEDPLPVLPHFSPMPTYPRMPSASRASSFISSTDPSNRTSTGSSTRVFSHVSTRYFKTSQTFVAKKNAANTNAAAASPSNGSVHKDGGHREPAASSDDPKHVNGPHARSPPKTLQQRGEFDIGIPPKYKPPAPLQAFQVPIIKGFTEGLAEIIKTEPQLDDAMESIRKFTSVLVTLGAPLDDWTSLALYVLQAVKEIEDLKEHLKRDTADADATAGTMSTLQKEVDDCSWAIQLDKAELRDSYQRLATAQQERVHLKDELIELQEQLANLQKRIKDAEDTCSVVQECVTRAESRRAQNSERVDYLKETMASVSVSMQMTEAKLQGKKDSISTLVTSVLSRISSFSCNA